jgi:hypothetical protein
MRKKHLFPLLALLALSAWGPVGVWARHGAPASTDRDAWINDSLRRLAEQGFLPKSSAPYESFSNLEAAESVARASERLLAQLPELELPPMEPLPGDGPAAPPPKPAAAVSEPPQGPALAIPGTPLAATPELQRLVMEYRKELTAIGVDVDAVMKRMKTRKALYATLAERQASALVRTGAEVSVYSRGYYDSYQTFGHGAGKQDEGSVLNDIRFRSVPVPKLLFEATLRVWGTYGKYFQDTVQKVEFRTLTLTSYNEYATLQAGDFFHHLTPLLLWNYTPVYTLLEPRPFKWERVDREELVMMDQGPDWRLRGGRINSRLSWPDGIYLNRASVDIAAGPVKAATTGDFASYWSTAQGVLEMADRNLVLRATGMRLWDDLHSAPVGYVADFPKTWAQNYELGSAHPSVTLSLSKDLRLLGNWEGAFARYNEDKMNGGRLFHDWASLGWGGLYYKDALELTGKTYDIGPHFYSPGAQTLRYTPGPAAGLAAPQGYVNSSESRDLGLPGYRNRFLFNDVSRPSFAPYDRRDEVIFPYGDATPNRKGFTAGGSMKFGKKGWFKPRGYYTSAEELKPNWVLVTQAAPSVDAIVDVESGRVDRLPRKFTGLDAAVELDLAAALGKKNALALGAEYKSQTSDLGLDAGLFPDGTRNTYKSDTIVAYLDVVPPHKWFKWADITLAYRNNKVAGPEYNLSNTVLAAYPFYAVPDAIGAYDLVYNSEVTTEMAFGLQYKLAKQITLRGDWVGTTRVPIDPVTKKQAVDPITGDKVYSYRGQLWRVMYEASF